MKFRKEIKHSDTAHIKEILESTNFFNKAEIEVAQELARENLKKGEEESGYIINIVDIDDKPVGFTCYGKIPGTMDSFDLYWIAVHDSHRGNGIGKKLFDMALEDIKNLEGKSVWIETSSRSIYEPTRTFYLKNSCEKISELPDYYKEGDNKVIYLKKI